MAHHGLQETRVANPGGVPLPAPLRMAAVGAIVLGLLLWIGGFFAADARRAWQALLHAYFFFMMLGMGGVVFTAIQYCASARWSIAVRRIAEGMGSFVYVSAGLFLILALFGFQPLYGAKQELFHFSGLKALYLSQPAVIIRGAVFYGLWIWMAGRIRGNSLRQDESRDKALYQANTRWSIAFLLVFGYTFSLHCVDLLMGLEPRWFSTMFGVYCFSGLFLSTMCTLALVALAMRRRPAVSAAIQPRHLYDLGTWIMAFSCFMCYIGFSQYMLIWYANLPEETFYLIIRTTMGWEKLTVLLPLLKWVIPFLVLMPQGFRGNPTVLTGVCIAVLIGQWLDVYWMIYPELDRSLVETLPGLAEIGATLAVLGAFAVSLDRTYGRHSVLPIGDPHLVASVNGSYI